MFCIRPLPTFTGWLDAQKDEAVRDAVVGGSKRTQKKDIERAKTLAALLD